VTDRASLTCQEVFTRLDDYLDRNLSSVEVALVVQHLDQCVVCAREYRFETTVLEGLKARLCRIELPPNLLSSVLLRLQAESNGE
jgi:anti-sigma factor (TIGR02949 family)